MNIADFEIYKDLLKEKSGLSLTQDKAYLIRSRLNPISKKWGYDNISVMTHVLRGVPPKDLIDDIIEAMTTGDTSFFRNKKAFDVIRDTVLPYYLSRQGGDKHIKIWCAAASSGQEPYSLAMLLKEEQENMPDWRFTITASDISHEILERAKEGVYTQFESQRGLSVSMLMKYFSQNGNTWSLSDEIKQMVQFKDFNLLDDMSNMGQFDIIFCRNVLVYFDEETRRDVLSRLNGQLADDGLLFLGYDENIIEATEDFKAVTNCSGIYAKSESNHLSTA